MSGETNKLFLSVVETKSKQEILDQIAKHYGVSPEEIYEEITDAEAEHLLDYMVEPYRSATYVLMQRYGFIIKSA